MSSYHNYTPADISGYAFADYRQLQVRSIAFGYFLRRSVASGIDFLLLRNAPRQEWGFPKGHANFAESPTAAALRECAEECGIGLVCREAQSYMLRYPVGKKQHLKATVYFSARTYCEHPVLSSEHDAAEWVPARNVADYLEHASLRDLFSSHLTDLTREGLL